MPEYTAISDHHPPVPAAQYETAWLRQHLERERHEASVLSEIREAVFGAQDGLTSVLAVVSTVGGATGQTQCERDRKLLKCVRLRRPALPQHPTDQGVVRYPSRRGGDRPRRRDTRSARPGRRARGLPGR